ncbi:hypothetical protein [uncultured Treponema sp.]|uniref:hypothetical protein n=1 Tax=uncultured Treponema sp. TaxID=162155 RepID=UPI0025F748B0|nr:hypothetical protein [uncultured Treponema sp.]
METQELFNYLKTNGKNRLVTKDYQRFCSILGNIKQSNYVFCSTESFESAKNAVSEMQSLSTKLAVFLSSNDRKILQEFVSSCQSEINEYGSQCHRNFMELQEQTGATVDGIPSFLFSSSSDDYDDYLFRRTMAEGLR